MPTGALAHAEFDRAILSSLVAAGRTLKRQVVLQGICRCAVIVVLLAVAHFILDYLLVLGVGPRAALLFLLVSLAAHQAWKWIIRPAALRVSPQQVAELLERRHPELRDALLTSVSFSTSRPDRTRADQASTAMIDATVRRSIEQMQSVRVQDIFLPKRHLQFLAAGLAAVVFCAGFSAVFPDMAATYVARDLTLRDVPWPSGVVLVLEGFVNDRLRWPIGDELTLVATATDEVPSGVRAEFESQKGERVVREMGRRGEDRFVLDYGPLQASLRVQFSIRRFGADERTRWYAVEAVERPAVKDIALRIMPPAYSNLDDIDMPTGQTAADVLRGSSVVVRATTNKPIQRAALRSSERVVGETIVESGRDIVARFDPTESGAYFFDLLDEDGLTDNRPVTMTLRVVADSPPKVKMTLAGVGEMVVPDAVLPLEINCEDNLGLRAAELQHEISHTEQTTTAPSAPQVEPLPRFTVGQTKYSIKESWPLLPLTLRPGDQLTVQARATDDQPVLTGDQSSTPLAPPNLGLSGAYVLRIVTAEDLSAELSRRENEWRREFELVIKSQEQLEARVKELVSLDAAQRASGAAAARLNSERRSQRQQASRLRTIGRQFEQILSEMEVNQLANSMVRRRLDAGVIAPMRKLATEGVPAAADLLDSFQTASDDDAASRVLDSQAGLVREMYAILANMLKWEGYEEAVSILRDIIRLQADLNEDTQRRLQEEVDRLFDQETEEKR